MNMRPVCDLPQIQRQTGKVWEGELELSIVSLDKQVKNPVGVVRELGQPHPTFTDKGNEQNRQRTQRAGKHQENKRKWTSPLHPNK